jgi:hypothetical protein
MVSFSSDIKAWRKGYKICYIDVAFQEKLHSGNVKITEQRIVNLIRFSEKNVATDCFKFNRFTSVIEFFGNS